MSDFGFNSICCELNDRISSNFLCALILTRSRLGLLSIAFHKFVIELWPLVDVPLNILSTNL